MYLRQNVNNKMRKYRKHSNQKTGLENHIILFIIYKPIHCGSFPKLN